MWWQDLLMGYWNGVTAWIVLVAHAFGAWSHFPLYDLVRSGNWYDAGFLIGAGSPLLSAARAGVRAPTRTRPAGQATAGGTADHPRPAGLRPVVLP